MIALSQLTEHVLALACDPFPLDLVFIFFANLQHLKLPRQKLQHLAHPLFQIERLQQILFFLDGNVELRGNQIRNCPASVTLSTSDDASLGSSGMS